MHQTATLEDLRLRNQTIKKIISGQIRREFHEKGQMA